MAVIALTVCFTVLLSLQFKLWGRLQITVLPAILHNYLACICTGWIMSGAHPFAVQLMKEPWFPYAFVLSLFFIVGFYFFGVAIQYWGMGVMTAVQKLSLIISASVGFAVTHTLPTGIEILGIITGIIAIPLLLFSNGNRTDFNTKADVLRKALLLAVVSWAISGCIEIGLLIVERTVSTESGNPLFIGTLFMFAFAWGMLQLVRSRKLISKFFTVKHLAAGWALGIPNYFSIYYLMRSLGSENSPGIVIPIINTATILVATLLGVVLFQEKLSTIQIAGVAMALLTVLLLSLNM